MTDLAVPYPVNSSNQALLLSLRALIDRLRQNPFTDTAAATAIDALEDRVQYIEDDPLERLTPQEAFELTLVTAQAAVMGSVAQKVQDLFEQVQAVATAAASAEAQALVDTGSIRFTQSLDISAREIIAKQVTELSASLGVTNASLSDEITARADGDSALSSRITTAESAVASNTASVTTVQESVNGISARWGASVNLQNQVVGIVQLDGTQSGSQFTVVADKFVVASNIDPATTRVIFTAGLINGVSSVGINGNVIVDGTILARHIATDNLSAISANIGEITAGLIRNSDDTLRFDLPAMRLYRVDGTMDVDLGNKRIRITSDTA